MKVLHILDFQRKWSEKFDNFMTVNIRKNATFALHTDMMTHCDEVIAVYFAERMGGRLEYPHRKTNDGAHIDNFIQIDQKMLPLCVTDTTTFVSLEFAGIKFKVQASSGTQYLQNVESVQRESLHVRKNTPSHLMISKLPQDSKEKETKIVQYPTLKQEMKSSAKLDLTKVPLGLMKGKI